MYTEFNDRIEFTADDAVLLDDIVRETGVALDAVTLKLVRPAWGGCQEILTCCLVNECVGLTKKECAIFYDEWMKRFGSKDWTLLVTSDVEEYRKSAEADSTSEVKEIRAGGCWCYA